MANLRVLTAAWDLYADENSDKIAGTYTSKCVCLSSCGGGIYPSVDCTQNPPAPSTALNDSPPIMHHSFPSWVEHPHQWDTTKEPSLGSKANPHFYHKLPNGTTCSWDFAANYLNKERDDQHAIACGTFWKYLKDYKIYRCPNGDKDAAVTYVGSDGMNGIHNSGNNSWCAEFPGDWKTPAIYIRSQIRRPAERIVFLDLGYLPGCSYILRNQQADMVNGCWYSSPPVRHSNGATFCFADGHTEYRKWTGHAVTWVKNKCVYANPDPTKSQLPCSDPKCSNRCSKDLFFMAKGICGSIGGTANQDATIAAIKASGCEIE